MLICIFLDYIIKLPITIEKNKIKKECSKLAKAHEKLKNFIADTVENNSN